MLSLMSLASLAFLFILDRSLAMLRHNYSMLHGTSGFALVCTFTKLIAVSSLFATANSNSPKKAQGPATIPTVADRRKEPAVSDLHKK